MSELDIPTREKAGGRPIDRDRRLWLEMQFFSADVRSHLKDVIRLLAKEKAGFTPYFAIDFEVLHGFLFPNMQSKFSRISPALVSYVMRNFPHKFILPPGTMIELLRFADRCFPILSRLESLRDSQQAGGLSRQELAEAIELYQLITGSEEWLDIPVTAPEDIARRVIDCASDVVLGFERLNELLASGRVVRVEDVCRGWTKAFEANEPLTSAIAAQLSAVQKPSSTRTRANNRNDARNIATILTVEQVDDPFSEQERVYVQLLTETRPILHLNLSEYGRDKIAEELVAAGELLLEFTERNLAWFASTVSTAAVYCAFRDVYGDVQSCYKEAKNHYIHLADFRLKTLKLDRQIDELGMSEATARLREAANEGLSGQGLGPWYFPLRETLQQSGLEVATRVSIEQLQDVDRPSADVQHDIVSPRVHRHHPLEVLHSEHPTRESEDSKQSLLQLLKVDWKQQDRGRWFPVRERWSFNELTGEQILKMQCWPDRQLFSVSWPVRLDLEGVLRNLLNIAQGLGHQKSKLVAYYEASPERFGARDDLNKPRTAIGFRKMMFFAESGSDVPSVGLGALVVGGQSRSNSDLLLLPNWLVLETEVGDLHVACPYSIERGGPKAICNFGSPDGIEKLLKPLIRASHPLIWSSPVVDELERELSEWVRSSIRSQD